MAKAEDTIIDKAILSKLTIATMGCNSGQAKVDQKEVPVARFVGRARGIKEAKGKDGEAVFALSGSFEGTNLQNGRTFASGTLYLPGGVQDLILASLDAALDADATASLDFAFDVYSFPAPNAAGYSYRTIDLFPATRVDPLAELKSALEAKPLPRLAAV